MEELRKPGYILRDELKRRLVKLAGIARIMGVSPSYLTLVTTCKVPIKAAVALALEQIGVETAEYWLTLQMKYDLEQVRKGEQPAQL